MAVDEAEAIALYKSGLTMQKIGERLGVTRARVHQILKNAGVETGYRYKPRRAKATGKRYAAFRLTPETRALIDRLAKEMGISRTAVIARAVEELAARTDKQ